MAGLSSNNSIGFLSLLFQNVITADYLQLAAVSTISPYTQLYVSLHTADPGPSGNQSTNETNYGGGSGYTRIAVPRSTGGWELNGSTITNVNPITFGYCVGGSGQTLSYVGIGTANVGLGILLWSGTILTPLIVNQGVVPGFVAGALSISES